MYFKDVIGQEDIKIHLIEECKAGRIPHAQLFAGPEGCGKLPLAIAYARYVCCNSPGEKDACGVCPSCKMFNKLTHPDLHFVFPIIKKKGKDTVCDDYISEWRSLILKNPYFAFNRWLNEIGAENQQALIYSKESDEIIRKLSFKSSQGGYKIMIIWQAERMNVECANKILKLLEEPPQKTIFLLITENPDMLLQTIQSRTQRINIPKIKDESIYNTLTIPPFGLQNKDAYDITHISNGNFIKTLESISINEQSQIYLNYFMSLMRLCYQRKIREMKQWSEEVSSWGRERQKAFLNYCQRMIRENFILNFHQPQLNYLTTSEKNFSSRFAPFINERNIIEMMNELSEAQNHIEQNVNPKMVFFDFSLKMIVLLINKK